MTNSGTSRAVAYCECAVEEGEGLVIAKRRDRWVKAIKPSPTSKKAIQPACE
jgi:hypothetical protein